ncbi:MAG TPA: nucleoside deaminase [Arachidicoccus sp.]
MDIDYKFMREAIELSRTHMEAGEGGPFGCVIVKDGMVVGRGWNSVLKGCDPTAHAEVMAIRDACKHLNTFQLTGCDVYTSCEPCPMCLGALYWARPDRIFYANNKADAANIGFDDSFIYDEMQQPMEQRKIPMIAMDNAEALKVFKLWEDKKDKTNY